MLVFGDGERILRLAALAQDDKVLSIDCCHSEERSDEESVIPKGGRILRRASLAQDDRGVTKVRRMTEEGRGGQSRRERSMRRVSSTST